jgi:hypothetical protein
MNEFIARRGIISLEGAQITGSLSATGNISSNTLTVTNGITGTATSASYVEYSNVAGKPALVSGSSQVSFNGITDKPTLVSGSEQVSFNGIVDKPTLISGSSQITYSGISSIPAGIVSSSAQVGGYGIFATTGSNQFNGSQAITGSLTVTGQVVAQTLNVQQVTSSIVFSSGSNIFGNSVSNTQQFTGSLQVSGSSHYLLGNVGIGTASPNRLTEIVGSDGATLGVSTSANGSSVLYGRIAMYSIAGSNSYIDYGGEIRSYSGAGIDYSDLRFYTANGSTSAEKMRITSGGNVGIGTTNPTYRTEVALSVSAYWNGTSFTGGNPTALSINNTTTGGYDSVLLLQQTDSGGTTKLAGGIGLVGTGPWTAGNNASQVSDMYFLVKNDSGGISERMRIKSSGNVGIGTTTPGTRLEVSSTAPIGDRTLPHNILTLTAEQGNAPYGGFGGAILFKNRSYVSGLVESSRIRSVIYDDGTPNNFGGGLWFETTPTPGGTLTPSVIINYQGRVGIGNSSPVQKLHVEGSTAIGTTGTEDILLLGRALGGGVSFQQAASLKLGRYQNAGGNFESYTRLDFALRDNSAASNYNTNTTVMTLTNAGNVGIGTTNPSQLLEVVGGEIKAGRVDSSSEGGQVSFGRASDNATGWYIDVFGSTSTPALRFVDVSNSAVRMAINSSGNVGIGTDNPLKRLDVRASVAGEVAIISNDRNSTGDYAFVTSLGSNCNNTSAYHYIAATGGADRFYIYGNGTYTTVSDRRLKKDITKVTENYLDKVSRLNIVKYHWNEQSETDALEFGMIAQEVEELIPSIVQEGREDESGNKYKGIQSSVLPYILIKAIQELKAENDTLKSILQRNNIS